MSISKMIRFEIFKRDGFKCCYCGRTPPQVILEIDHIDPKAGGGKDDINNLITSCFDCNRGKKDIPLNKIPQKLADNLEVLKEKEEQIREYRKFIDRIERRIKRDIRKIDSIYSENYPGWGFTDKFKNFSIRKFLEKLPNHEVIESLYKAMSICGDDKDYAIKYFCGICWSKIREHQKFREDDHEN
jgi:hypothetical protein